MMPRTPINPIDISVGSRIRLRRTLMGMSQEQLGRQLGVTFQQVQKYEKGTNRVGASRLREIAQALGVSISYFFGEDRLAAVASERGPTAGILDVASILQSRDGIELNRAFIKIKNPETRRCIIHLTEVLAKADRSELRDEPAIHGSIAH
jgi:transcriptional regulator with XRE-family HTH domain